MDNWMPSAAITTLQQRARLMQTIRRFFEQRGLWEVEVPMLSHYGVSDRHLVNFTTEYVAPLSADNAQLFLQTSPEYAMKRLLAAGSGGIYSLNRCFRNEEAGSQHNPEFTMLEWYQPNYSLLQLMDEVDALLQLVLSCLPAQRVRYYQLFIEHLGFDSRQVSLAQLQQVALQHGFDWAAQENDADTLLMLLFSEVIEPKIGWQAPVMVSHFPATQAALAQLCADDPLSAQRVEVYFQGLELANGFAELTDVAEQRQRFAADNRQRQLLGLPQRAADERFLAALAAGLPPCSGIALGIDRLMMLALDKKRIAEVLAFDISRA